MHAGRIFFFLIYSQSGIKLFHKAGVVVTLAAEGRNVDGSGPAQITLPRVLRCDLVVLCRIPAVTIVAGETSREMDVVFDRASGIANFAFQPDVTFNTRAFLLAAGAVESEGQKKRGEQQHQSRRDRMFMKRRAAKGFRAP